MPLPIRLAAEFPPDLTAIPLEDIDPYYQNKKVEKSTIPVKLYINLVEWRPLSMEENFDNFLCKNMGGMYYGHRESRMEASLQSEKVDTK